MAKIDFSNRDNFGSKFGVIAAAAGSAIGLGNIWRFPYVAGENGGAAFILMYIFFIAAIGIPVMLSEFVIGRKAQRNPYGAFKKLAPGKPWYLIGIMGVATAFIILAFYSTVAGWTMEYLFDSLLNKFQDKTTDELNFMFESFRDSSFKPVFWQVIFMFLTGFIVFAGVKDGIEKYAKILMPILFVIIIILCARSLTLPGAMEGIKFLFMPDFSKVNALVVLEALGQAFFSLSIGMGTLITYGSYISKKENLGNTAVSVTVADSLIAILAGIAIFPAVFAFSIEPNAGPGLVFMTLPNIFQQMAGGYIFSLLFFLLLVVAALTSSISVLEVVVAYFVEELNLTRGKSTIVAAISITILGFVSTLSWGVTADLRLFGFNFFDFLDYLASNIMLPLGGLFIVIFVAWYLKGKKTREEISNQGTLEARYFPTYKFLIKYIAPIAIALVFLNGTGILQYLMGLFG